MQDLIHTCTQGGGDEPVPSTLQQAHGAPSKIPVTPGWVCSCRGGLSAPHIQLLKGEELGGQIEGLLALGGLPAHSVHV